MASAKPTKVTTGSLVGYADNTWQIGAVRPPNVCLCCGLAFDERKHRITGPYEKGPYRYVCLQCWKLPFLFFPNKKLARCGECWIPPRMSRHTHYRATAPRGARVGRVAEALRRSVPISPQTGKSRKRTIRRSP